MQRLLLYLYIMIFCVSGFEFAKAQNIDSAYVPITPENIAGLEQIAVLQSGIDGVGNAISELAFHPTQPFLFSLGFNEAIGVWDMERFEFVETLPLPTDYSTSFALSPDGEHLVYGGWNFAQQPDFARLNVWSFRDNANELILRNGQTNIEGLTFNRDGTMYAAYGWQHESAIRVWSLRNGQESMIFPGHGQYVFHIGFAHNNRLVTTGADRKVNIWNLETREIEHTLEGFYFALHPQEPIILVTSMSATGGQRIARMYDLERLDIFIERDFAGTPFAFNATGEIVATTSDSGIWLYDFKSVRPLVKLTNNGSLVIAFSPDGRFIAIRGAGGTISILGIPT